MKKVASLLTDLCPPMNLAICLKQAKREINTFSETIYRYYDLKANACD